MMLIIVGLGIGTAVGWSAKTAYLRFLWKQDRNIRRAMRGAQGRRRR